jgi:hypothetical protein
VVEYLSEKLVDASWWPARRDELAKKQMPLQQALELSEQLAEFVRVAENSGANGIVGDIDNYDRLEGAELFSQMLNTARQDLRELLGKVRAAHE